MIDTTPPAEYLRHSPTAPTAADSELADRAGTTATAPAQFWHVGRVANMQHLTSSWAARREGVERWARRAIAALALALAGNLWVGYNTMQGRAADAGAARAHADDQAREIEQLRLDVRGLWQKVSGVAPPPPVDTTGGDLFPLVPVPKEFTLIAPPGVSCPAIADPPPPPLTMLMPSLPLLDVILDGIDGIVVDGIDASIHTNRTGDCAGAAPPVGAAPRAAAEWVRYPAIETPAAWEAAHGGVNLRLRRGRARTADDGDNKQH